MTLVNHKRYLFVSPIHYHALITSLFGIYVWISLG